MKMVKKVKHKTIYFDSQKLIVLGYVIKDLETKTITIKTDIRSQIKNISHDEIHLIRIDNEEYNVMWKSMSSSIREEWQFAIIE